MAHDLPLQGVTPTHLPAADPQLQADLDRAVADGDVGALRAVVRRDPRFLDGWARLGEAALALGATIDAYAFARVGYHRGLDAIRGAGWRGQGPVPWSHEPNRGFLRSLWLLGTTAAAIGETDEAQRCAVFLQELARDHDLPAIATG